MTRIIAGMFKGRPLSVPAAGTRPTTDRVREALMSRLETLREYENARALDLYAGSGALGFEALSRGAGAVTFVDSAHPARTVLVANARSLGVEEDVTCVRSSAEAFLASSQEEYDIVFLDPPYDTPLAAVNDVLASLAPRIAQGGVVVAETSAQATDLIWPVPLTDLGARDYGGTSLHWGQRR